MDATAQVRIELLLVIETLGNWPIWTMNDACGDVTAPTPLSRQRN